MYRHCNTYWPMLPHVFDYTGYTMSTRYRHYVSTQTSPPDNSSEHHRCNTLHQYTVIAQYNYYHWCYTRLNNTHC